MTRYLAAYLPHPTDRCSHDDIARLVTDRELVIGDAAQIVQVPVSGGKPVAKVMCRRCGATGGALPRWVKTDGAPVDVATLPDRERPTHERGIPTTYRSTNFRSRLEARWAAFFDLIGWRWTYEPLDAEGYIPDFLIHGEAPFLVEVGPCVTREDYEAKAEKPSKYQNMPTLIVGVSPVMDVPHGHQAAGLLVNEFANGGSGMAYWYVCGTCVRLYVYGDDVQRPCGHPFRMTGDGRQPNTQTAWAEAGNAVQWRPL